MSDQKSPGWRKAAKGIRYREHLTRKHGKRPDRYYVLQYKRDGKTINESVGWASDGVTQADCEKKLVALRDNWRSGEGPQTLAEMRQTAEETRGAAQAAKEAAKERLITVKDYFEQRYQPQTKRTLKQISWAKEASLFKFWLEPVVGKISLVEVGLSHWDAVLKRMDKAGLSQRTKEYAAGVLRRILRHALDRDIEVKKIPTARRIGASAPKDNRRLRVLTPAESETILTELEARDLHAWRVVKFAMLTGCRASEAFSLRWRDVDLEGGQLRLVETKNKETRPLLLTTALSEMFKSFGPGEPDAVVFPRSDGKPHVEAPHNFKKVIEEQRMNVGRGPRDRISFHSIRHTVATKLAATLDIRSLMDVMGWKQVSMAARYVHSNENTKRAAMETLAKTLDPQEKAKVIPFTGTK